MLYAINTLAPGDHFVWAGWRFVLLGPADAMGTGHDPCRVAPYYVARPLDAPGYGFAAHLSNGRLFHALDMVEPYDPAGQLPLGTNARVAHWRVA